MPEHQERFASQSDPPRSTASLRGFIYLLKLSLVRLVRFRPMFVCGLLLTLLIILVIVVTRYRAPGIERFTRGPTIRLYLTFLTPIFCICFSTASLANDREDQTLVYLLTSSLPRGLVHLAKFISAWLVSMLWVGGGFALMCVAGGDVGRQAFQLYWPSILLAGSAYSSLFHFFGTYFQRATIYALVYALFLEVFVGNMPGSAKRIAIAFYAKSHMAERATVESITLNFPRGFLPIDGATALLALVAITVLFLVLGTVVFQQKEYVSD